MLLNEFFGKSLNLKASEEKDNNKLSDELFWFFLDHDKLHKDYVIPAAKKMKKLHKEGQENRSAIVKEFMPMVQKGCIEYYKKNKMEGNPAKLFPEELCKELCEKLYDHYHDDVIQDHYNLGI